MSLMGPWMVVLSSTITHRNQGNRFEACSRAPSHRDAQGYHASLYAVARMVVTMQSHKIIERTCQENEDAAYEKLGRKKPVDLGFNLGLGLELHLR